MLVVCYARYKHANVEVNFAALCPPEIGNHKLKAKTRFRKSVLILITSITVIIILIINWKQQRQQQASTAWKREQSLEIRQHC